MTAVRHLAIEGAIGVGKTSLVHRLHGEWGGARFLEVVEGNPFLTGGFYQDMERYAFDTEMFFLLSRFRQQRDLAAALEGGRILALSDYVFEKNRIFAGLTLTPRDLEIWQRLFDAIAPDACVPDLTVYLRADLDVLMDRIRIRNRPFERDLERAYMARLVDAYDRFFEEYPARLLVVDVTRLDFVGSEADFAAVRALIEHKAGEIEAGQRELALEGRAGG
ncbi:MAG TPA: deoxynucleoside kinase [Gemmatimonadota bacterium]|nr:deoxynucleoside kinase [Gemmatimonadota bacterium]